MMLSKIVSVEDSICVRMSLAKAAENPACCLCRVSGRSYGRFAVRPCSERAWMAASRSCNLKLLRVARYLIGQASLGESLSLLRRLELRPSLLEVSDLLRKFALLRSAID